jgi:hypothetical protein
MVASFWVAVAGVAGLTATGVLAAVMSMRSPNRQDHTRAIHGDGSPVASE